MPSPLLPLDDRTQLFCEFGLHGWSQLIVLQDGALQIFPVSGVFTDFAAEMMALVRATIDNVATRVALADEPGGVIIDLTPDPKQHHVICISIYDVGGSTPTDPGCAPGVPVLMTCIRRRRFMTMIIADLWKAHVGMFEQSYQKYRDPFPHDDLVALNEYWNDSTLGPSFLT